MIASGRVKVSAKSSRKAKVKVALVIRQGGADERITERKQLKLRPQHKASQAPGAHRRRPPASSRAASRPSSSAKAKAKGEGQGEAQDDEARPARAATARSRSGVAVDTADRCDPITPVGTECLFPYPNDHFTRADSSTDTGLRLNLQPASMPTNSNGDAVRPDRRQHERRVQPRGADRHPRPGHRHPGGVRAHRASCRSPAWARPSTTQQPLVLIDAATGERQLIWAELDANATSPEETDLLIHPGRNLLDGHRYIVALRNLQDAGGNAIAAPPGFKLYRDNIPTDIPAIENRRAHFEQIFSELGRAQDRALEPLHGLGLHRRQRAQPLRADALDPQRRLRAARRHRPRRRGRPGPRARL